jgi:hypothetical protein
MADMHVYSKDGGVTKIQIKLETKTVKTGTFRIVIQEVKKLKNGNFQVANVTIKKL